MGSLIGGLLLVLSLLLFVTGIVCLVRPSLARNRKTGEVPSRKHLLVGTILGPMLSMGIGGAFLGESVPKDIQTPAAGTSVEATPVKPVVMSAAAADAACAKDLQCQGDKGTVAAGLYCKDEVERLAKHSVKWTDGFLEPKFSRFRWTTSKQESITFIGDKATFQNGFGAFTPVVYECDMAADLRTVLNVRVSEGRLPR